MRFQMIILSSPQRTDWMCLRKEYTWTINCHTIRLGIRIQDVRPGNVNPHNNNNDKHSPWWIALLATEADAECNEIYLGKWRIFESRSSTLILLLQLPPPQMAGGRVRRSKTRCQKGRLFISPSVVESSLQCGSTRVLLSCWFLFPYYRSFYSSLDKPCPDFHRTLTWFHNLSRYCHFPGEKSQIPSCPPQMAIRLPNCPLSK